MTMSDAPSWDEEQAQNMVGLRVLIGITRIGPKGTRQDQMFGVVALAQAENGFQIKLEGTRAGDLYWLPPDLRAFHAAPLGEYRLRSTGEVVIDPDYTVTWTVNERAN